MEKITIGIVNEEDVDTSGQLNSEVTTKVVDNVNKQDNILNQPTSNNVVSTPGYELTNTEKAESPPQYEQVVQNQPGKFDSTDGFLDSHQPYVAEEQRKRGAARYERDADDIFCFACLIGCQDLLQDAVRCVCCRFCCRKIDCCQCDTDNDSCECCGDSCPDCCSCCGDCRCDCDCGGLGDCCDGLGSCCGDICGGVGEFLCGCIGGLFTCFS